MLSCPVYGLFGEVGSVEFEPQTLYWSYRAILSEMRGGFPRLYFHGDGVNLGAFSREGLLTGRISRRALGGEPQDGAFTILRQPWRLMTVPGFPEPMMALFEQGMYTPTFAPRAVLPEAALERFCFLYRSEVEGEPCWLLRVNEAGDPVSP
ncbi:MAG: hypothetical protein IJT18_03715 [Oscillospiraceae bacterium]|nr:hypothetical protein [Oscillospiraceae bacterium]